MKTVQRRNLQYLAGIAAAVLLATGCAGVSGTGGQAQLAGSVWQLVGYQAAGAGTAEVRPARPDQYQLRFGADGRLSARVDCNQGSGTWAATPGAAGGASGSLMLGPLATTRMMCPPSPLAGRLPGDIEAVRSYRIDGGRLHLELAGGGGTYTWERMSP
ncbi:META domain-containing protein [Pseudoduganella umbonata]|uniref:Heat shock protein HslJ n=1 Tax=Pseudoduganella umbonata TaxID=864828 RepID=A0A4P8HU64_9BURK|nr:META domain-containing protein [Pseudoduganella umbonata]MBB3223620.1 heat shock protein HslJ [Pseudoduganella umbonata]QCP13517.1 META domain-containing protein [Pseudoduganella umbonata]